MNDSFTVTVTETFTSILFFPANDRSVSFAKRLARMTSNTNDPRSCHVIDINDRTIVSFNRGMVNED